MTLLLCVRGRYSAAAAAMAGCRGETSRRFASVLTRVPATATATSTAPSPVVNGHGRQSKSAASVRQARTSAAIVVPEPYLPLDTGRAAFPFILSPSTARSSGGRSTRTSSSSEGSTARRPTAGAPEERRVRAQRAQRMLEELESTLTASSRVLTLLEQREQALSTAVSTSALIVRQPVPAPVAATAENQRSPAWMAAGLVLGTVTSIAGYQAIASS